MQFHEIIINFEDEVSSFLNSRKPILKKTTEQKFAFWSKKIPRKVWKINEKVKSKPMPNYKRMGKQKKAG